MLEKISHYLTGKSIQIIGATGFVGRWLLESLIFHNERFNLNLKIYQVGRKPISELINHASFQEFDFTKHVASVINTDFVIFAGTPSQRTTGGDDKFLVYNSIELGLRSIVDKITSSGYKTHFFNCSSGTVLYPWRDSALTNYNLSNFDIEDLQLTDVYKASKILSEKIILQANNSKNFLGINGRLWTFYGKGIPLDAHFAIGNFMLNVLNEEEVTVKGNANTLRSYLYPVDMTVQIIVATVYGNKAHVSIGSQVPISIGELAKTVSMKFGSKQVKFLENKDIETSYYPNTSNSSDLSLVQENIDLVTGLQYWYQDLKSGTSNQGK